MFGTFVWANFARSLTLEIVQSLVKLLYVNFICCQIEFIKAEIQLLKYTIFGEKTDHVHKIGTYALSFASRVLKPASSLYCVGYHE